MVIIFGLGNPGRRYAKTRHNVGFMAVDAIAKQKGIRFWRDEHKGFCATYYEKGEKIMLVKPQTYMNLSGICVKKFVGFYRVPLENIAVIYDDIDMNLGQLRIRKKGGPGTHNGMRSIVDYLGSGDFPRFRFGVGPKRKDWDLADFVLSRLTGEETEQVNDMCLKIADAVSCYVTEGIDNAMNRFNSSAQRKSKE